ncbi:unnamed protein product [Chironomus riparius]|uniref:Uncharacterized protein n=1 Tax=Chironomus riparius TaxID=315576 RepID=A0A9N9RSN7_9DIPT|nr:unnamed protein product [Chironomus riparius]
MKVYIFIILISLQLFGLNSINVDCNFNSNWDYMVLHRIYRCEVENHLDITSPDSAAIKSITGYHWNWRSNDDVEGFDSRHKNINYFPQRLDKFFGNLKLIAIYYGRIKEIHQSDLKPFPKLVNFYLDNNDIETLEPGLFDFNPNLEGVSFLANKLIKIDSTIFDHLVKLQNIWFGENLCISTNVTDSIASARNVIKQAKQLCSSEAPGPDSKDCVDSCDFQNRITESVAVGFKTIITNVDNLQASFEEQKSSKSENWQTILKDWSEDLDERLESYENKTKTQLDKFEKEFEASQNKILTTVDEKISAIESRLVGRIEQILDEKLKKIYDALNLTN